jgi:uncharacterized membrane protein YfcA
MAPILVAGLAVLAVVAGTTAAIAGFGIGSLLTPALAIAVGTQVAVAAVAVPHLVGSAVRLWLLRSHIDRRVLLTFGVTSAAGGIAGALLQGLLAGKLLALIFGGVLVMAGALELTGLVRQHTWSRKAALAAGVASGFLGGLVGNQGGIRAAAMLGFEVPRQSFVATATAAAIIVDAARLPVYLVTTGPALLGMWPLLAVMTAGVAIGTIAGASVLRQLPEATFRRVVGVLLIALGIFTAAFVG